MSRSVFIIPGYKHKDTNYPWLLKYFRSEGYKVYFFDLNWNYLVMSEYANKFKQFYKDNASEDNYIFGFSYGAMTALITAKELCPDRLILCSISPYFKEDLKVLKPWWKAVIGIRRVRDFANYSAVSLAQSISIPTVVIYGEAEAVKYPQLKKRCVQTAELIADANIVEVADAPHDITHDNYVAAIKDVLRSIRCFNR